MDKVINYAQSPNIRECKTRKPLIIVLHSTGGGYDGSISWLRNSESGVSAHYVVARDGRIMQLAQTKDICWHAGKGRWKKYNDVNKISVGIEQEHIDGKSDWPDEQIESTAYVCKIIMEKYGIPVENIVGHRDVAPGRKVDPDDSFPWHKLRDLLK
jgi:N-acetyl-anhydromuramyl-L-alanine amidase AmpD